MNKIKVIELFAGVGGFRLGLEGWNKKSSTSDYSKPIKTNFEVVWSNQWEPSSKIQHANLVYKHRWPKANHSGVNIEEVIENDIESIPQHDLLVGGFPCQDYSVATKLRSSKGLIGKKGVLWWSIYSILKKSNDVNPTKYILLENVDRLLSSPSKQRGRDFAVILTCLNELGYAVEWKVINAADYGMPQKRKRIYIVGYHKSTSLYKKISTMSKEDIILKNGIISEPFPSETTKNLSTKSTIGIKPHEASKNFNHENNKSPFHDSGFMIDGEYLSLKTKTIYKGEQKILKDIILPLSKIPENFKVDRKKRLSSKLVKKQVNGTVKVIETEFEKWQYLKGRKNEIKVNRLEGYEYKYFEGNMSFPDPLDKPSRTIVTAEGGAAPSRFKHIIKQDDTYRRITPLEMERLNMFPDNHTLLDGISDSKRAFFMGNALVVGVVEKIGENLYKKVNNEIQQL